MSVMDIRRGGRCESVSGDDGSSTKFRCGRDAGHEPPHELASQDGRGGVWWERAGERPRPFLVRDEGGAPADVPRLEDVTLEPEDVEPLGDQVCIRVVRSPEEVGIGGGGATAVTSKANRDQEGYVVRVGPECRRGLRPGDRVIFGKYSGADVQLGPFRSEVPVVLVMDEQYVLARVNPPYRKRFRRYGCGRGHVRDYPRNVSGPPEAFGCRECGLPMKAMGAPTSADPAALVIPER